MVGVAQWLEYRSVEPVVAGSTPVAHPKGTTGPARSPGLLLGPAGHPGKTDSGPAPYPQFRPLFTLAGFKEQGWRVPQRGSLALGLSASCTGGSPPCEHINGRCAETQNRDARGVRRDSSSSHH